MFAETRPSVYFIIISLFVLTIVCTCNILCATEQAALYVEGGASVLSVLTEPKWFKGSLEDLSEVGPEVVRFSRIFLCEALFVVWTLWPCRGHSCCSVVHVGLAVFLTDFFLALP